MKKKRRDLTGKLWLSKQPEKVYGALLTEIRSGRLHAGARVLTEKELCRRFNVCRNTVRSALARLVAEKWLIHRPGAGCMVAPMPGPTPKTRQLPRSNTVSFMYHGSREIIVWLQNLLLKRGYLLSLFSQREQGWDPGLEALFLRRVVEQRHLALLASCTPREPTNAWLLAELAASGVRVIHLEPYSGHTLPAESFIMPDYKRAGYAAAATLLLRGYDPIFYVGDMKRVAPFHVLQERGFLEARRELLGRGGERRLFNGKTPEQANFIGHQFLSGSSGQKLVRVLGKRRPGFFCADQELAVMLIDLLRREKMTVPEKAGVLAPELIGDQLPTDILAQIRFPRQQMLEWTVKHAIADDFPDIRELVPPSDISGATLRALDSEKKSKNNEQS